MVSLPQWSTTSAWLIFLAVLAISKVQRILFNTISCEPNASVWMALLGACRVQGNVEMGECIAK